MIVDDKVIINRPICANNQANPHHGKTATVIKVEEHMICVAIDSFPNCNHREYHNRFWYEPEEMEVTNEESGETIRR